MVLDENYRIISKRSKIKIKKPRDSGEFLGIIILKLGSLVFSVVIIFNSAIVPFQNNSCLACCVLCFCCLCMEHY